ncbi:MAG: Two-component response regulator [Labilithrix sp.]|nr:Two-component response regulator [Labilithrix sp.]
MTSSAESRDRVPGPAHLLIVEDDDDIRELMAELLAVSGHVVSVARDGVEGLRHLEHSTPDIILLDVDMPRLDGPGMVFQMHERGGGWERIPVILLSGSADLALIARRVGTRYFLEKPTDLDLLIHALDRALRENAAPTPAHELGGPRPPAGEH